MRVLTSVHEGPELIQTTEEEHVLQDTGTSDSQPGEKDTEQEVAQEQNDANEDETAETDVHDGSGSTEEDLLLQPTPISNPLLKSVLDITPPTPRDASPLQIAIERIHPPAVEGQTTSPVERKEEEVRLPTEVCEFPVISTDEESSEAETDGTSPCMFVANLSAPSRSCGR